MTNIAIIGSGKLGCAIADGLLESGIPPETLYLTRRKLSSLKRYSHLGVNISSNNGLAVQQSEVVILCVKPQKLISVIEEIRANINTQIIISTVTGVDIQHMSRAVQKQVPLFRAMPNTAAAIKESMTCISTINSSEQEQQQVMTIFKNLGDVLYIDDELMASATVLAASGIAFALRYIRAAMQGGIEIGFPSEIAQTITAQTLKGAAELILQQQTHPEQEIDKVTTPQGITITGLNKMENEGFSASIIQGILASQLKIKSL